MGHRADGANRDDKAQGAQQQGLRNAGQADQCPCDGRAEDASSRASKHEEAVTLRERIARNDDWKIRSRSGLEKKSADAAEDCRQINMLHSKPPRERGKRKPKEAETTRN